MAKSKKKKIDDDELELSEKNRETYFNRISELMKSNRGKLTPYDVVEDAKSPDCPYHNFFEWDDTKAGAKYRLMQARQLLNATIKTVEVKGEKLKQKAFFNVKDARGQNFYVSVESAVQRDSYRLQLINQLLQTMDHTQNLLRMFQEHETKSTKKKK